MYYLCIVVSCIDLIPCIVDVEYSKYEYQYANTAGGERTRAHRDGRQAGPVQGTDGRKGARRRTAWVPSQHQHFSVALWSVRRVQSAIQT